MNSQLLIISISLYIISIIAGLILAITGKKLSYTFLKLFSYAHISFFIALIALSLITFQNALSQWLIVIFFCTGMIFSGIMLRRLNNKFIKLYFIFFPLTLILFIYSPSRFFKTVYSGDISRLRSNSIALSENYFIEKQDIFGETEKGFNYKIYLKKGIITETVATGIYTEEEIDSVKVLLMEPGDTLMLRLHYASVSKDIGVSLKKPGRNRIRRE